ncbi:hypothetical protein YPPY103_0885, partial [Yersinia pestis PY-103]
MEYKIFRAPDG